MPLYEYNCPKCKKIFETIVSISRQDDVKCPDCGCSDVERVLSLFSTAAGSSSSCSAPSGSGFS